MKKALYTYLQAVMRYSLFGMALWGLFGVQKRWPLDITLLAMVGPIITAAMIFSPYLLFSAASYRVRQLLYFAPLLLICLMRTYTFYLMYTGRYVEMKLSHHDTPVRLWHIQLAECFIVLGVCISIYRRHKTFYDGDPVEELLK